MYQVSYTVKDMEGLRRAVDRFETAHPEKKDHLLILLFSHVSDPAAITRRTDFLHGAYPGACIAGESCFGGIRDTHLVLGETVVSFLSFTHTEISLLTYDLTEETSGRAGEEALAALRDIPDLAGVCVLATLASTDATPFMKALSRLPADLPVFGGGSHTYTAEEEGRVFNGNRVLTKGIVVVTFAGNIRIGVKSLLGWHGMGRYMTITATNGDLILKTLDGRPAMEVYEKYLRIRRTPTFGREILSFPLVLSRHGKLLARLPAGCLADGSLLMNGDCVTGERVRLAYGDPSEILRTCRELADRIWHFHPEGLLMFSCITRRQFMRDNTDRVLSMYSFAPSMAGGYVRGEIKRTSGVVDILNMTQVTAGFSEKGLDEKEEKEYLSPLSDNPITLSDSLSTLERLAAFVSTTSEELEEAYHQISFVAEHDGLTGLLNRSAIEGAMAGEIKKTAVTGTSLSAIMVDLDNFKGINDTYGHEEGDAVLKTVARLMRENIRRSDYAGRWGGDEFVILLPGTPLPMAEKVARRIREAFLSAPASEHGTRITASFGCTTSHPGETQEEFYKSMDSALYKAKESGKNQVVVL